MGNTNLKNGQIHAFCLDGFIRIVPQMLTMVSSYLHP